MPDEHCKSVSPSSLHRVLRCPESYMLTLGMPDSTSEDAEIGTEAHALCEYKLKKAVGMDCEDPRPRMKHLSPLMEENSDVYVEIIMENYESILKAGGKPYLCVEQRVEIPWVKNCFGTADAILIGGNSLHVYDYKNGKGVPVSAEWNPQIMAYALGAYERFAMLFGFENVDMTIVQPNLSSVTHFRLGVDELIEWANNTLTPVTNLALEGKGGQEAGEWCRFCKVKAICRTRADAMLQLAQDEFTADLRLLDNDDLGCLYGRLDEVAGWVKDVKEHVMNKALAGERIPGWKLVEGKSNRKFSDEDAVAARVREAGYNPYKEPELLGITAMTELLGRKGFQEVLGNLVVKPAGKPTLVPMDDPRKEIKASPSIEEEFDEIKGQ